MSHIKPEEVTTRLVQFNPNAGGLNAKLSLNAKYLKDLGVTYTESDEDRKIKIYKYADFILLGAKDSNFEEDNTNFELAILTGAINKIINKSSENIKNELLSEIKRMLNLDEC